MENRFLTPLKNLEKEKQLKQEIIILKNFLNGNGILKNKDWDKLEKEYNYLFKKYSPKEFKDYIEIQHLILNLMIHYKKQQIILLKPTTCLSNLEAFNSKMFIKYEK